MMRDGGQARIEYAEVTLMGQKGEFGRYPLHVIIALYYYIPGAVILFRALISNRGKFKQIIHHAS
jgi:hypothetical protein